MTNPQNNIGDVEMVATKLMGWKNGEIAFHLPDGGVRVDFGPDQDENDFRMCTQELMKDDELWHYFCAEVLGDYQMGSYWTVLLIFLQTPLSQRWEALVSTIREHA